MSSAPAGIDGSRYVVLSPHLDDAVFSTWHILSSSNHVSVVTVYSGIPDPGFVTSLDRAGGAVDSAAWMRRRLSDDRAALSLAHREPIHLGLLDVQYRACRIPRLRAELERELTGGDFISRVSAEPGLRMEPDDLRQHIAGFIGDDTIIYAPAGIGGHPDHQDVARFGITLAQQGYEVRLYADTPYYLRHGLPTFLANARNSIADDVIEQAFNDLSCPLNRLRRHIVQLEAEETHRKILACRRYVTEFEPVNTDFAGIPSDPNLMCYEVFWTTTDVELNRGT